MGLTTPAAGGWAWTYGATGQATGATAGNGNTVANTFDAAGRELTRTTRTGATPRAAYTWTFNRAGLVLSEASTITGDASNGTVTYGYDALGRLTSNGATATTWDAAANRTGQGSSTTAFDPANRPTSGTSPTTAYSSDQDGRLTGRPGQTLAWDHLGRLASVTTASGTTSYAYDPLDRLRTVQAPSGARTRFRYTGLTTSAAAWIDDLTGTVTRSLANSWTGEHLADWDPAAGASSRRVYGTNAHHDTTWLADSTGAVVSALRYDPWGVPRAAPPAGYTPFRFQGSWTDAGTDLAWAVTRWYAPSLGTFISEDSLLGQPEDPGSRHLYAYGQGEPVGSWDPEGTLSWSSFAFSVNVTGRGIHTFENDGPGSWTAYLKTERQQASSLTAVAVSGGRALRSYTSPAGWRMTATADRVSTWASTTTYIGAATAEGRMTVDLYRRRAGDESHVADSGYAWIGGRELVWFGSATCCGMPFWSYTGGVGQTHGPLSADVGRRFTTCTATRFGRSCVNDDQRSIRAGDYLKVVTKVWVNAVSYLWAPAEVEFRVKNFALGLGDG